MSTASPESWDAWNQRHLVAMLEYLRGLLQHHAAPDVHHRPHRPLAAAPPDEQYTTALGALADLFDLSSFEQSVLLLCAGIELEGDFPSLCARAQGSAERACPTFGLALAAFPDSHWSALSPARPLRRWHLIEIGAGGSLTAGALKIDERILNFLTGVHHVDERLAGVLESVDRLPPLVPSHEAIARQIAAAWQDMPIAIQLCDGDGAVKRAIVHRAMDSVGLTPLRVMAAALPSDPQELERTMRLAERECLLGRAALLLDCDSLDTNEPTREQIIARFVDRTQAPLIVATRDRRPMITRPLLTLDVRKPTAKEQRSLWKQALPADLPRSAAFLDRLVSQFQLDQTGIHSAAARAVSSVTAPSESPSADDWHEAIWNACRANVRPRLDGLAHRIEAAARWDDLVLSDAQQRVLHEIVLHVRHRATVYERWGLGPEGTRGLGVSAMFAGASGTGKTMAAEVLARELQLDLYRIDLSSVVSKYIGETEKNLRRIFDAAEEGGAILLFDEADALFGKRTEVKDSHDRYANIEVSYLLQRVESYRGLSILTTNLKDSLDTAFQRRIRFVVAFPFPDAAQRAEIWKRVFPAATPTEDLDARRLAQLSAAGGTIRNIAVRAAFLAAEAKEPVRLAHILAAARSEYEKLERPLTDAELRGWADG